MATAIEAADLIPYSKWRPAACDTPGLGLPDHQDWLVAPCSTHRDADCLQRANWLGQHKALLATGEPDQAEGFAARRDECPERCYDLLRDES